MSKGTRDGASHVVDAVQGQNSDIPMGHPATAPNTVPHNALSPVRDAPNHRKAAADP